MNLQQSEALKLTNVECLKKYLNNEKLGTLLKILHHFRWKQELQILCKMELWNSENLRF